MNTKFERLSKLIIISAMMLALFCACDSTNINADTSSRAITDNGSISNIESDILLSQAQQSNTHYQLSEIPSGDYELIYEISANKNSISIVGLQTSTENGEAVNIPLVSSFSIENGICPIPCSFPKDVLAWSIASSYDNTFFCIVQGTSEGSTCFLQQYDANGVQLLNVDIQGYLTDNSEFVGMYMLNSESLILATTSAIIVFDAQGNYKTLLQPDGTNTDLIITDNGCVIVCVDTEDAFVLYRIESDPWQLTEYLKLSNDFDNFSFIGSNDDTASFFFYDYNTLYSYHIETNTLKEEYVFSNLGILESEISTIAHTMEGGFLLACWSSSLSSDQLFSITPTANDTAADVSRVTIGGITTPQGLLSAISDFNRVNDKIKIEYIDYSEQDSYEEATSKLNLDIVSGTCPDIILLNGLKYEMYASKGVLYDLYSLIDADPSLSRDSFLSQPLSSLEYDDHLYRLADSFSIATQIGLTDVIGNKSSWTLDELITFYSSENKRLFLNQDKQSVLVDLLFQSMDEYIDFENSSCSFDSDNFCNLLSFINNLDSTPDSSYSQDSEAYALAKGATILMDSLLTGFDSVQMLEDQFDGRAVYIGYPSTTSSGSALYLNNSLAISASSSQKEAAWAFIKYFLTGDHYNSRGGWSLLTEKYEDSIEIAKANEVSQATIDTTERLINSIDHTTVYQEEIFAIIQEETESMFAGDKTAEDIAPIIQQRVMIYLSENS